MQNQKTLEESLFELAELEATVLNELEQTKAGLNELGALIDEIGDLEIVKAHDKRHGLSNKKNDQNAKS